LSSVTSDSLRSQRFPIYKISPHFLRAVPTFSSFQHCNYLTDVSVSPVTVCSELKILLNANNDSVASKFAVFSQPQNSNSNQQENICQISSISDQFTMQQGNASLHIHPSPDLRSDTPFLDVPSGEPGRNRSMDESMTMLHGERLQSATERHRVC